MLDPRVQLCITLALFMPHWHFPLIMWQKSDKGPNLKHKELNWKKKIKIRDQIKKKKGKKSFLPNQL